jgi:hypothetical protein
VWRRLVPLALWPLWFDGESGGGAPATGGGGATPPQPQGGAEGAKPPAPAAKPAGDGELGETGKRALEAERERAKVAERERDDLQKRLEALEQNGQSEHERAIAQARREATAESDGRWAAHVRAAEVRGALRAAGVTNDRTLQLLQQAPEVRDLDVDAKTGEVKGVTEAVAKLQESYPETFSTAQPTPKPAPGGTPPGQWDGGQGGNQQPAGAKDLGDAVDRYYQAK